MHPSVIRRFHLNLLLGPVVGSIVLIALIGLGIERLVNPLLLGYLMIVGYVLLGVFEAWEPRLEELRGGAPEEDGASAKEQREHSDPARTDG